MLSFSQSQNINKCTLYVPSNSSETRIVFTGLLPSQLWNGGVSFYITFSPSSGDTVAKEGWFLLFRRENPAALSCGSVFSALLVPEGKSPLTSRDRAGARVWIPWRGAGCMLEAVDTPSRERPGFMGPGPVCSVPSPHS